MVLPAGVISRASLPKTVRRALLPPGEQQRRRRGLQVSSHSNVLDRQTDSSKGSHVKLSAGNGVTAGR